MADILYLDVEVRRLRKMLAEWHADRAAERRFDWRTPPSLYNSQERLDADIAWHKRHDKPTDPDAA